MPQLDILTKSRIYKLFADEEENATPDSSEVRFTPDFKEFLIEELNFTGNRVVPKARVKGNLSNTNNKITLALTGNQLPLAPFNFGGSQRITKTYYPGNPEPSTHVLGATELDTTINGHLKDIKVMKTNSRSKLPYGTSYFIMQVLDTIRQKGNLCKFTLGEWVRYGFLSSVSFSMKQKSRIDYQMAITIVSDTPPSNTKFLDRGVKAIDFKTNEALFNAANDMNNFASDLSLPDLTILEIISSELSLLAGFISIFTGAVGKLFSTIEDIRQSRDRVLAYADSTQERIVNISKLVSNLKGIRDDQSIDNILGTLRFSLDVQYRTQQTYCEIISNLEATSQIVSDFRDSFARLNDAGPLARYLVIVGDTWQSIAVAFYRSPDNWALIPRYNFLTISDAPPVGTVITIPQEDEA